MPNVAPWRSIDIFEDFEAARADWDALYALAPASAYQSYQFVSAWFETLGKDGLTPFLIVARDADARPLALLPLARVSIGPLRAAVFMGGRESNFNLGLFRPDAGFDEATARRLLREAARQARPTIDVFYLRNAPRRFDGGNNPLAFVNAPASASFAYGTTLPKDPAKLIARVSKNTRKKLRKKEASLAELGALRFEHCATGERAREILAALVAQKAARLSAMGVASPFSSGAMAAFLERLRQAPSDGALDHAAFGRNRPNADNAIDSKNLERALYEKPIPTFSQRALEAHALSVSDRIVATYVGFVHAGRFSGFANSFDADEVTARASPGDLLLHALLANLALRGVAKFDLGVGEARYKGAVCDETIELCDAVLATSWRGALAAPILTTVSRIKRLVKQAPWMMRIVASARRMFRNRGR